MFELVKLWKLKFNCRTSLLAFPSVDLSESAVHPQRTLRFSCRHQHCAALPALFLCWLTTHNHLAAMTSSKMYLRMGIYPVWQARQYGLCGWPRSDEWKTCCLCWVTGLNFTLVPGHLARTKPWSPCVWFSCNVRWWSNLTSCFLGENNILKQEDPLLQDCPAWPRMSAADAVGIWGVFPNNSRTSKKAPNSYICLAETSPNCSRKEAGP